MVTVLCPRAIAASIRSMVSSGHLICAKWTSLGSSMPASAIARRTASAVASICADRPSSSGREITGLGNADAQPLAGDALASAGRGGHCAREHREMRAEHAFGAADITNAIFCSRRGDSPSRGASAAQSAATAYSREIIHPAIALGLPSTARMVAGSMVPASIRFSRPETSPGPLVGIRTTSTRNRAHGHSSSWSPVKPASVDADPVAC